MPHTVGMKTKNTGTFYDGHPYLLRSSLFQPFLAPAQTFLIRVVSVMQRIIWLFPHLQNNGMWR
jgi:hypothetical protein